MRASLLIGALCIGCAEQWRDGGYVKQLRE